MRPQISQGQIEPTLTAAKTSVRLRFNSVTHRFGARVVFSNVCGEVANGEILVVTGANGSGKSTLLRIAAGLLRPESGAANVEIDGRSLDTAQRRRYIGYAAPDLSLYRELTAAENLTFFASLRGVVLDRGALVELLTTVGLKGRGRNLVGGYSSGMRTRLKLAFALIGAPPILLLDEPTANLDVDGVAIVEELVFSHRARNGVVVIEANEPREVEWADRLIRLGETVTSSPRT